MNLERAVEVLLERGALDVRGAKAELARLMGVEPREVWWTVAQIRRRSWMTTLPKAKVRR